MNAFKTKNAGGGMSMSMSASTSTITLTLSESVENHVGMQKLGSRLPEGQGFTPQELQDAKARFEARGFTCELVSLWQPELAPITNKPDKDQKDVKSSAPSPAPESACVLIVRGGVGIQDEHDRVFAEQAALPVDKKAFMRGRVVNKKARWNLCFGEEASQADYEQKKGRVVAWDEVPLTHALVTSFVESLGPRAAAHLTRAEGNYYYDVAKCGIGFHGDGERRLVAAIRLGAPLDLHYRWFHRHREVGTRITLRLNGGDMYVMSEKAVGTDWLRPTALTLRHATGAPAFVNPPPKAKKSASKADVKADSKAFNAGSKAGSKAVARPPPRVPKRSLQEPGEERPSKRQK